MQTTDSDTEFRKQAVESMPFLVANKDPEISVMCVICLYFASQSMICRDPIARSGMLTVVGGEELFRLGWVGIGINLDLITTYLFITYYLLKCKYFFS